MKITKFQPDQEGIIHVTNCVRLLNMGLQNDVVTIWAITDSKNSTLPGMNFSVKSDNERVDPEDVTHYVSSFISDKTIQHLFGEEPQKINPKGIL